jgi:hypothetical protein
MRSLDVDCTTNARRMDRIEPTAIASLAFAFFWWFMGNNLLTFRSNHACGISADPISNSTSLHHFNSEMTIYRVAPSATLAHKYVCSKLLSMVPSKGMVSGKEAPSTSYRTVSSLRMREAMLAYVLFASAESKRSLAHMAKPVSCSMSVLHPGQKATENVHIELCMPKHSL